MTCEAECDENEENDGDEDGVTVLYGGANGASPLKSCLGCKLDFPLSAFDPPSSQPNILYMASTLKKHMLRFHDTT